MASRSVPTSVPTESFLLLGFSFRKIDLGGRVSADSTGVAGCIDCVELILAVRSDSGNEASSGGSPVDIGLKSGSDVKTRSSSRVNKSGDGASASSGSSTEAVVVTEAIVSREVRLRKRGWRRWLAGL